MSYSQGGKIDAADYNNFINGTNQLNTVWSTGTGDAGYGQTAVPAVSQTGLITATQWASLINTLNNATTHQSGSSTSISAVTAGSKINYLSTLGSSINTAYTNRALFASNASVTAGSALTTVWSATVANPGGNPPTGGSSQTTITRAFGARAAFASADQARYFFNAGGRLKLNLSGTQNASTTGRTNEIISLIGYLGGVGLFASKTNAGRTGTGGTLGTNDTTKGYYTSTYNANVSLVSVTSTTTNYTSDTGSITVNCNGTQGSNGDNGLNVDFWVTLSSTSGSDNTTYGFDDSFGVNVIRTVDISYPETTNLSNSWGTITVSSL